LEIAMEKRFILFAAAMLLTGCVSTATKTIDAQASSAVRNQSVVASVRAKPDFAAMTAVNVQFGLLGAAWMISEGNKIIAAHKVPDPANAISAALSGAMQSSQGIQLVEPALKIDSEDPTRIADLAKGKARYVLDVRTLTWQMLHFPFDWTHYQVMYTAKARLIDVDARNVVAEAFCKYAPESSANAPSYDQMLARSAARLKAALASAAEACAGSLGRDMLALQGPIPMRGADIARVSAPTPTQSQALVSALPEERILAPAAPVADAGGRKWQGTMTCDARKDRGLDAGAYKAWFSMEVQGETATMQRSNGDVVETLSGHTSGNRLKLNGTGYHVAEPMRTWRIQMSGAFPADATSYHGTGATTANGRQLRKCELWMVRT
jgi:hypothetical protein